MRVLIDDQVKDRIEYLVLTGQYEAAYIAKRLQELGVDPYPSVPVADSEEVEFLKKQGLDIRRFKSLEFPKYRVFYLVDAPHDTVYVMHIVERAKYNYEKSPKITNQFIKKYHDYFKSQLWKT